MNLSENFKKAAGYLAGTYGVLTAASIPVSIGGAMLTGGYSTSPLVQTLAPIFETAVHCSMANGLMAVSAAAVGSAGFLAYKGYQELNKI